MRNPLCQRWSKTQVLQQGSDHWMTITLTVKISELANGPQAKSPVKSVTPVNPLNWKKWLTDERDEGCGSFTTPGSPGDPENKLREA